jgi:starch synthase
MRVLFLAAEAAPISKVGGLADVAGELPRALATLGVDVRLALPLHLAVNTSGLGLRHVTTVDIPAGARSEPADVFLSDSEGVPFFLIAGEPIALARAVYGDSGEDALKYTFFSLAALALCPAIDWRPDILHANDWHTAPAVQWLVRRRGTDPFWRGVAAVLTIHNLAFMGAGGETALATYGLPPSDDERLPVWARNVPLPIALSAADWLTTVSPTYAEEIQTPGYGCGLEGFLSTRKDHLAGILNGIDPATWDPATDPDLHAHYTSQDLLPRSTNKRALQEELDLPTEPDVPLLVMVTRLDLQKGVDLALEALSGMGGERWRFAILGTGDPEIAEKARAFSEGFPDRARTVLRFDPSLSRRFFAGADIVLLPSRYEPCGLTQMIAMRYGCIPVVRATGGLKDTVADYAPGGVGTGFTFAAASSIALAEAIQRALQVYADGRRWRALQRRAMEASFTWRHSAERYLEIYRRAAASASAPGPAIGT